MTDLETKNLNALIQMSARDQCKMQDLFKVVCIFDSHHLEKEGEGGGD